MKPGTWEGLPQRSPATTLGLQRGRISLQHAGGAQPDREGYRGGSQTRARVLAQELRNTGRASMEEHRISCRVGWEGRILSAANKRILGKLVILE